MLVEVLKRVSTIFTFCFVIISFQLKGQNPIPENNTQDTLTSPVTIKDVFILGNKRTKNSVILREMSLKKGSAHPANQLTELIKKDEERIYNTDLFNEVKIEQLIAADDEIMLFVQLTERWYIYPSLVFQLADRNFNDWWVNQNRSFRRVNFGLGFQNFNFRGRRELLSFSGQIGFERKFQARWRIPFIEKSQRHGLAFAYGYSESRNVGFQTEDHVKQFVRAERILTRQTNGRITYRYRKSFYNTHRLRLWFQYTSVDDSVRQLNALFFDDNRNSQRYLSLTYEFVRDLRNNHNYPTDGQYWRVRASKTGIGIFNEVDIFTLTLSYNRFIDFGNNFSLGTGLQVFSTWPDQIPFERFTGLGLGQDLVRGYEQDLIEGRRYVLFKNSIRKRIFKHTQNLSSVVKWNQFQKVPLSAYFKIFFDAGWVDNYPNREISNRLSNKLLYSAGAGIDLVTLYDIVTRFELSYNAESQVRFALRAMAEL